MKGDEGLVKAIPHPSPPPNRLYIGISRGKMKGEGYF